MKVKDLNAIWTEAQRQVLMTEWDVRNYITDYQVVLAVFNIYMTNDIMKGFGQDFQHGFSIITSPTRCSVIGGETASFWKDSVQICGYDNLQEDIESILIILQAAVERWEENVAR